MPPCFDRWCKRFDDIFKTKVQRKDNADVFARYKASFGYILGLKLAKVPLGLSKFHKAVVNRIY